MNKAITINLDSDLIEKLRQIQASSIEKNNTQISFSKVVNQTIKNYFERHV